jgi:integrase
VPKNFGQLDHLGGEYINFLYQDESPLGWAGDFISGLKRLFPSCRRHLETTSLYYRNWVKATVRVRALPMSQELIRGMAAMAIIDKRPRFAAALLIGFCGLLRVGEITQLESHQVKILSAHLAIIFLPDSKGAKLKGHSESILIRDNTLVSILQNLQGNALESDLLFDTNYRTFASNLLEYSVCFGVQHQNLTPHGLRRGGATWHFSKFLSYDKTQEHGRWAQSKTCKQYIDEALTETGRSLVSEVGRCRLRRANASLSF